MERANKAETKQKSYKNLNWQMEIKKKEQNKFKEFKQALFQAARGLWNASPLIIGTILLVSLISTLIPKVWYSKIFTGNSFIDSFLGSLAGSVSAGSPIISYIIAGELSKQGVGLVAITAFIVAWVTVGVVQLPAESAILGKKFAITRNLLSFLFSIIIAIVLVSILNII